MKKGRGDRQVKREREVRGVVRREVRLRKRVDGEATDKGGMRQR